MVSLALVRDGLQAVLDRSIAGLTAHTSWPGALVPPAILIKPTTGRYGVDLGGLVEYHFELTLVVRLVVGRQAQDDLDDYLSSTGGRSIVTAIDNDPSLNGTVDAAKVTGFHDYGDLELGTSVFLGAILSLECLAP